MSFFSKNPKVYIDYIIDPDDWQASSSSTTAKLSLERMKFEDTTDPKKQLEVRSKSWYVDIPFYLKGIVDNKVVNVGDQMKGRFFGKDPAAAKEMFEIYYTFIKKQETEKLKKQQKEQKVKQVIKATQAVQATMAEDPTSPDLDVTQALSQGEPNPTSPTQQAWTNRNVNALASQQAMSQQAEKALAAPQTVETTAQQRNKLRAAMTRKPTTTPTATKTVNARTQQSLSQYKSKAAVQTRKQKPAKPAVNNAKIDQQIATMFNGGKRNNVTRKRSQNIIMKV